MGRLLKVAYYWMLCKTPSVSLQEVQPVKYLFCTNFLKGRTKYSSVQMTLINSAGEV
jgi:hypothetical protein